MRRPMVDAGRLGRLQQRAHHAPAFLEGAALCGEEDGFVEVGAWAEMIAEFVMRCTQAFGGSWKNRTPTWG